MTDRIKPADIDAEAWRLHREEGEPEGYQGPCWGPTQANIAQARANLVAAVSTVVQVAGEQNDDRSAT